MFLTGFLTAIYVMIALAAAAMTYDEQRRTNGRNLFLTLLGFGACTIWPVTVLGVAIAARFQNT